MTKAEDFQDFDSPLIVNSVLNAFLSYTAIMLNILTIHALRKTSSLPKPLKTLILSLAVSDLGVGLLAQPLKIACLVIRLKENTENDSTYKVTNNMHNVTSNFLCCASLFGVTALAADRFLTVHLHLRYQELVTHRRVVATVILIWLLSAIYSPLWLWNQKIFTTVTGIVPTVCLISTSFFYCKIYLAVRRHRNQIHILQVQAAQNDEMMANTLNPARQIKSAVGTFYVYLVFLGCYLPLMSINVVYTITGTSNPRNTLWDYIATLVYLNSSLNPLIYCWKMRYIRHAIIKVVRNVLKRND